MERKSYDHQKTSHHLKLPAIQHRKGQSSRILSSTMPDNSRVRPSSLQKVDDLEKKLFQQLDSYQGVMKKGKKRNSKKKLEAENASQRQVQGYDRMQKLMPGLYTKLVQAKKGVISQTSIPSDTNLFSTQPKLKKLSNSFEEAKSSPQRQSKRVEKEEREEQMCLTEEEFDAVYRQYSKKEQLQPETSNKELKAMSQNLQTCEKQIAELTQSMESMINQIGREYIEALQQQ